MTSTIIEIAENAQPNRGVPVIGAGASGPMLIFPDGDRLAIRAPELAVAKRRLRRARRRAAALVNVTERQAQILADELLCAERFLRHTITQVLGRYGITKTDDGQPQIDPNRWSSAA